MKYNGLEFDSPESIVNAFGEYFSSVYITSNPVNPNYSNTQPLANLAISTPVIHESEILAILKCAKNTMTSGCDGIPSFLLRDCANIFAKPLYIIFTAIFRKAKFPTLWKNAYVSPILKKGSPDDVLNYRPISILCNFSKVFESILYKHIYYNLKSFISPDQHGFMQKRSTVSNLACFTQFSSSVLDNGGQVDTIYLDFQKAFDQIDLYVLLDKLQQYGITNELIALLTDYLFDRRQFVKFRNYTSNPIIPTSGVPQGSNLGPLLFLIFINDITRIINCQKLLFADDIKLYSEIKSTQDCIDLQNNLNLVMNWCHVNRLSLNIDKCQVVRYTKKLKPVLFYYNILGFNLTVSENIRDLGVVFDSKLSFIPHICQVISKSFSIYGFIYRNCREFTNTNTLTHLFFALVRSRLEYAAIIWSPLYNIHISNLEAVQRHFLKFLSFRQNGIYPPRGYDNELLLSNFGLISLRVRRSILAVKFLHGLINNYVDCSWLVSQINFRVPRLGARDLTTFYCVTNNTNLLRKSPVQSMCDTFNLISSRCDINFDSIGIIVKCLINHYN